MPWFRSNSFDANLLFSFPFITLINFVSHSLLTPPFKKDFMLYSWLTWNCSRLVTLCFKWEREKNMCASEREREREREREKKSLKGGRCECEWKRDRKREREREREREGEFVSVNLNKFSMTMWRKRGNWENEKAGTERGLGVRFITTLVK